VSRAKIAPLLLAATLAACGGENPPPLTPPIAPFGPPGTAAPVVSAPAQKAQGPVVIASPNAGVVALRVAFAAGSADDPPGKERLTKLVATTMAEGGTKSATYAELVEKLYPYAASIDEHVDRDETVFEVTVAAPSLDAVYPIFRDVILAPRFDAASFARLRARQTSALTSGLRGANDEELGKEGLEWLLYEGHPYGHPAVGTERGLASITLDDVRAHYARVFCKERALVGVAGAYPAGFDKTVADDVAKLPACAGDRAPLPPPPSRSGMQLVVIDKPSAQSTAISIGFPTQVTRSDEAEYPGLLLATDILGLHREFSGRLMDQLRHERGLNYGDYAYAEFFEQEGWTRTQRTNTARREQFVSMWLRPVKRANAAFALKAALYFYDGLVKDGVTPDLLERQRAFVSRLEGLQAQTMSRRLGYAMDDRTYGLDAPYLDVLRKGWSELDAPKLNALMKKLLDTKNLAIVIVSSDAQKLADELVKGDPSSLPAYDAPKSPEIQAADKEIAKLPLSLDAKAVRVIPVGEMFK